MDDQLNELYGDLGGGVLGDREPVKSSSVPTKNIYEINEELEQIRKENEQLRARVQKVEGEKSELKKKLVNLARNISSLFNTAKLEIQRKDREIQRLRDARKKSAATG